MGCPRLEFKAEENNAAFDRWVGWTKRRLSQSEAFIGKNNAAAAELDDLNDLWLLIGERKLVNGFP